MTALTRVLDAISADRESRAYRTLQAERAVQELRATMERHPHWGVHTSAFNVARRLLHLDPETFQVAFEALHVAVQDIAAHGVTGVPR